MQPSSFQVGSGQVSSMNQFATAGNMQIAPMSNQISASKQAWMSRPDIIEDFDTQMEKEKARLNRFIGVKELNNRSEVERNEKLRKSIMKKEQKYNQKMKKLDLEQKMKKGQYDLTNEKRKNVLVNKAKDILDRDIEAVNEVYKPHLEDVKERLER